MDPQLPEETGPHCSRKRHQHPRGSQQSAQLDGNKY